MEIDELLTELFTRIHELVPATVEGLSPDELSSRPDGHGNSIAWLVWHLSRVQDDHIADAAGTRQVWDGGWRERFDLDLPDDDGIGYGHTGAEVAKVQASVELLIAYHEAVAAATQAFIGGLGATDLDRIVDKNFDPPVTLGVRLTSILGDCLQHAGQAAYVRGLITGAR